MTPKRKINDCFHYYNGFCYKGNNCHYRHEPRALDSNRVCRLWRRHHCFIPRCPHRHAHLRPGRQLSPRYWEDRTGWSPFLKSRYFTSCDPESSSDSHGWQRRVFFPVPSGTQENNYFPRTSDREWNGEMEGRFPLRDNIRVVLEWVNEANLQTRERLSSVSGNSYNFLSSVGTQCSLYQNPPATVHSGESLKSQSEQKSHCSSKSQGNNSNTDMLPGILSEKYIKSEHHSEQATECFRRNEFDSACEDGNTVSSHSFEASLTQTGTSLVNANEDAFSWHKGVNINTQQQTHLEEVCTLRLGTYSSCSQTHKNDQNTTSTPVNKNKSPIGSCKGQNRTLRNYLRVCELTELSTIDVPEKAGTDGSFVSPTCTQSLKRSLRPTSSSERCSWSNQEDALATPASCEVKSMDFCTRMHTRTKRKT